MSSIAIKGAPLIESWGRLGRLRGQSSTLVALALGPGVNTAIFTLGYLGCMALHPHPDDLVVRFPVIQLHMNIQVGLSDS